MKKEFLILLAILFVGCVTQPEIRYYKSYYRSPEFKSYIQEDSYKIWYDEKIHAQFIEVEKDSTEWKTLQKRLGTTSLDHFFYNRESGIAFVIVKYRYKISHDKLVKRLKKSSDRPLIESDQRMVNNTPLLYVRIFWEEDGNKMMLSAYYINHDSGSLAFMIICPEDIYGKHREMIEKAMNGIELNKEN